MRRPAVDLLVLLVVLGGPSCGPASPDNSAGSGSASGTLTGSGGGTLSGSGGGAGTSVDSGPGTASTAAGTGEVVLPAACECLAAPESTCEQLSCDLELICPAVSYTCPRPEMYYPCALEYEYDEEALSCALTALRDRTPGLIIYGGEEPGGQCGLEGCPGRSTTVAIAADGTALSQSCRKEPLQDESGSAGVGPLWPPEYFQECLDRPVPSDRYACLGDILETSTPACGN